MATILVVDDDSDIRNLLTDLLAPEGHIVHTATNGSDALNMVQSRAFDLALVDIQMPGMSGIELLERLKDLTPEMPVIIITGRPTCETAVQALRSGARDYLQKPFALDDIRATVNRLLKEHCPSSLIQTGQLTIDLAAREVHTGQEQRTLT